jgi:glycosyltransferase involved in cell wall biosynthesis
VQDAPTAEKPIVVAHARIVSGTGGGPEKTILATPRHLKGSRYSAFALYLHAPGDPGIAVLQRRAEAAGCELVLVPDPYPFDPRTLRRLVDIAREREVGIWHGHDYKSNFYGLYVAKQLSIPFVTTMHGWVKPSWKTPLYFAIDRWCLRRARAVMAVSQDLYEAALRARVDPRRLSRIENGIDTGHFRRRCRPEQSEPRVRHKAAFVIGAVGRLSIEKGFDLLIRACEALLERGHDFELWIAGEGDQEASLRAQIAASPHRERLRLMGFQEDTRALFESFDLFALSSLREGLPNVVLEAMALELPVLATRCGGLAEFLRDGEDARLVEPGSVEALVRGLGELLESPALRSGLGAAARARVVRECSFAQRIAAEIAVYERLER